MEVTIFATMAVSTSRTAFGLLPLPGSLKNSVDGFGQFTAVLIFAGALLCVIGILWRHRDDGLVIEQFGLAVVGPGCLLYALALWLYTNHAASAFALAMAVGIGLACGVRYFQIQRYITKRKNAAREGG